MNKTGRIQWQKSLGGTKGDKAYSVQQRSDSGFIVAGNSESRDGDVTGHHYGFKKPDYWIVKIKDTSAGSSIISPAIVSSPIQQAEKIKAKDFTAYPVPAKDVLFIQTKKSALFLLIDLSGKTVLTKNITAKSSINISQLPAGMYYLRNNETGKLQKVMISR